MLPLVLALLCVLANAFFVAAEFALAKVRPTALEALARAGDEKAKHALTLTRRLDAYLTATQFGITLASLGLGWLGEPAISGILKEPLLSLGLSEKIVHGVNITIAFAVITLLHIVVGELIPKSLAIQRPEDVTRHTARALHLFFLAAYPFLYVLNGISNVALRAMGLPPEDFREGALSVEELRLVIQASFHGGNVDAQKHQLIERVLRGTDRPVRAIMIPRVDIVSLSLSVPWEESLVLIQKHGYSRFPITEGTNADQIVGYVYTKDLLLGSGRPRDGLRGLKRDILFVPATRTVGELLSDFRRQKIPIAIVVDEYGGTMGLVTLEDTVEEIVGEIQDEHDTEAPRLQMRDDGTVVVDGSLPVSELQLEGLDVPPIEGGETVGGYVVSSLGRLALPGDTIRLGAYEAVVEDVRRRRVSRVALHPRPETIPPAMPLPSEEASQD